MQSQIQVGDRVRVHLAAEYWMSHGWFEGTVLRIDPYSSRRQFYWVELDVEVQSSDGVRTQRVSVLNPVRIEKI